MDGDGAARVAAPVALVGCLFVGLLSLLLVSPSRLTSVDHRSSLPLSAPQREAPLVGSMGSPVTVPLFPYWGGGFGGCGRQWRSSAALVSRPRAGGGGGGRAPARPPLPARGATARCSYAVAWGGGFGVASGRRTPTAPRACRLLPVPGACAGGGGITQFDGRVREEGRVVHYLGAYRCGGATYSRALTVRLTFFVFVVLAAFLLWL